MKAEERAQIVFCVAKVLLVVCFNTSCAEDIEECAYMQFMEATIAGFGVERELGFVWIRWATDDEVDTTLEHIFSGDWS